jgi:hypothetical protein
MNKSYFQTLNYIKRNQRMQKLYDLFLKENMKNQEINKENLELDNIINANYTLSGNIEEIEIELNRIKKEKNNAKKKKKLLINKINKCIDKKFKYRFEISKIHQLNSIDYDIQDYKKYLKEEKINNINLKKMKKLLPDEIIAYIKEFFTLNTKCELLESKYKPLKIINKFTNLHINNIFNSIFKPEMLNKIHIFPEEINRLKLNYRAFYKYYESVFSTEYNNNNKKNINRMDEKKFLKYIVISRYSMDPIYTRYELFKIIIILHKILNN